jgi:hypothetical protein
LALLTDFEELMENLIKYVSQLVIKEENLISAKSAFRIKTKMCACLEAMMQKHQFISFNKSEFQFRQMLVGVIMEWISDFSSVRGPISLCRTHQA